jgi:hypothetical protein
MSTDVGSGEKRQRPIKDDEGADEAPRGSRPWESVRTAKVRQARALIKDPNFPSKPTLEAVAKLLARELKATPADAPNPASTPFDKVSDEGGKGR